MGVQTLARRTRWAPGPGARIDWSHPLARGCVVFAYPEMESLSVVDVVSGKHSRLSGAVQSIGLQGGGVAAASTSSTPVAAIGPGYRGITTQHSAMVVAMMASPTTNTAIAGIKNGPGWSPQYFGVGLIRRTSSFQRVGMGWRGAASFNEVSFTPIGGSLPTDEHTWLFTVNTSSSTAKGYDNGRDMGAVIVDYGALTTAASGHTYDNVSFCGFDGTGDALVSGYVSLYVLWNRELSANEADSMYADPYQFIIDPAQQILSYGLTQGASSALPNTAGFKLPPYINKFPYDRKTLYGA